MARRLDLKWLKGVGSEGDRSRFRIWLIAAGVLVLVIIAIFVGPFSPSPGGKPDVPLPNFKAIASISERKQAFFDFLGPLVTDVNERLLNEREDVSDLRAYYKRHGELSGGRLDELNSLLAKYAFEEVTNPDEETFTDLLSRVDIIPPSMALAQAAVESGWGTSRFAREGNNLFGMWCYTPGCGMVPSRRAAGAKHEVTRYDSPRDSFESYIHNLNTNQAYVSVRVIRRELRAANAAITGSDLARGLVKYSSQRWEYVSKIQSMISSNQLERFDVAKAQ